VIDKGMIRYFERNGRQFSACGIGIICATTIAKDKLRHFNFITACQVYIGSLVITVCDVPRIIEQWFFLNNRSTG
jgi:hypothetical protein